MEENTNQIPQQMNTSKYPPFQNNQSFTAPDVSRSNLQEQQSSNEQTKIITTHTNNDGQLTNKKESKLKYILYFLLGLIFFIPGLIIGIILILIKHENAKMRKLIVLLLGTTLWLGFWMLITGGIKNELVSKSEFTQTTFDNNQPKTESQKAIITNLSNAYPNISYTILYGENNPPFVIGNTTISNYFIVELKANQKVTPEEKLGIGKTICSTLKKLQLSVSNIEIKTIKKFLLLDLSNSVGGTCEEYDSGSILSGF